MASRARSLVTSVRDATGTVKLVAFGASVEVGPAGGRTRLGAARVLDDAVQADELGDHDLAHVSCPFLVSVGMYAGQHTRRSAVTAEARVRSRR